MRVSNSKARVDPLPVSEQGATEQFLRGLYRGSVRGYFRYDGSGFIRYPDDVALMREPSEYVGECLPMF